MKEERFEQKNYFIVSYGIILLIVVFALTILLLNYLTINNQSVLKLVIKYYLFRK